MKTTDLIPLLKLYKYITELLIKLSLVNPGEHKILSTLLSYRINLQNLKVLITNAHHKEQADLAPSQYGGILVALSLSWAILEINLSSSFFAHQAN